jgi:SAM-dependent methyltransferase
VTPKAIDYFSLGHPLRVLTSRVSARVREELFAFFLEVMQPTAESQVLDVGVTPDESLVESNFFERLYPYKDRVIATSIEDASFLEGNYPGLRFVMADGMALPFKDAAFDIVFCSAVMEHVGSRDRQRIFVQELLRVGKRFFITTPNRQFPMEFHTILPVIHWLPQPVHQKILRGLGMEFWSLTENLNLLTASTFMALFPSADEVTLYEHRLLGLPSNLVAYGES